MCDIFLFVCLKNSIDFSVSFYNYHEPSIYPCLSGFGGFFLLAGLPWNCTQSLIFLLANVVQIVVNHAIRLRISLFAPASDAWAYKSSVIVMLACPMIYCKFFGFMFFCASCVQNVCLRLWGVILGNGVFSWFLLYFFTTPFSTDL